MKLLLQYIGLLHLDLGIYTKEKSMIKTESPVLQWEYSAFSTCGPKITKLDLHDKNVSNCRHLCLEFIRLLVISINTNKFGC